MKGVWGMSGRCNSELACNLNTAVKRTIVIYHDSKSGCTATGAHHSVLFCHIFGMDIYTYLNRFGGFLFLTTKPVGG